MIEIGIARHDDEFPTTIDQVREDSSWVTFTEEVDNMDKCAEAYLIFALICDHAGMPIPASQHQSHGF